MNILRKALATEAAQLKPLLDRSYHEIHTYQRSRTAENELQQPWSREMLELFDQRRAVPSAAGPASDDFLCSGIAAAPVRFVGFARVVLNEASLESLKPGEILVCRMSTPDWLPWFSRIRALVTDQGGALCHAAVVARELGLPCVTGCQEATTVIRTGDRIEVNGELGLVTRP